MKPSDKKIVSPGITKSPFTTFITARLKKILFEINGSF